MTRSTRTVGLIATIGLVAVACGGGVAEPASSSPSTAASVPDSTTSSAAPATTAPTSTVAETTTTTVAVEVIESPYPIVDGDLQLPEGTVKSAYDWLVAEVASPETTAAEIEERFTSNALSGASTDAWIGVIDEIRNLVGSEFRFIDLVAATPVRLGGLIKGDAGVGWLNMTVQLEDPGGIAALNVVTHNGNLMYADDRGKTMTAAMAALVELGERGSVMVARVDDGACTVVEGINETHAQPTGSIFKHWVLAAVGDAIGTGQLSAGDPIAFVPEHRVAAGAVTSDVPDGTEISVTDMARLMMGESDNSATDILHEVAGRDALENVLVASGHSRPELMTPFLSVNEQFALFWNVTPAQAEVFNGSDEEAQQALLDDVLDPQGPARPQSRLNDFTFVNGTWNASPVDICNVFAYMRAQEDDEAFEMIDAALSAQAAQTKVRNRWDRVWYKGGSLAAGGANGPEMRVLTHSWFLESAEDGAYVVVGMANRDSGGVDVFVMQSLLARILELTSEMSG